MNQGTTDLTQLETSTLAALERNNTESTANLKTLLANGQPARSAAAAAYMQTMEQFYAATYGATAQRLAAAGRPRVAQRMNELIAGCRAARASFQQAHADSVRTSQAINAMEADFNRYRAGVYRHLALVQQQGIDAAQQHFNDVNRPPTFYCPFCYSVLGPYFSGSYCPRCYHRL